MADNIKAILIFEMLGRPADYLKETLINFVGKISKEDGIEVTNKNIHEPKKLEESKQEIFATFAETEINFKGIDKLLKIIFVYMPSHIEIISPEELRIKNFDLNALINELIRKLHQYDELAKRLSIERGILQKQLQQQGVKPATFQLPKTEKAEKKSKIKKRKKKN